MTDKINERVIRLHKGQTLYVICPPYQPFRVFYHPERRDLVIDDRIEPQDVPEVEENAPAIPEAVGESLLRATVYGADRTPEVTEALEAHTRTLAGRLEHHVGEIVDAEFTEQANAAADAEKAALAEGHDTACAERMAYGDGNCQCSKLGFTPTMPERFNRSTETAHVAAITETLGPVAQLYKHEKEVLGATITTYTHDPVPPGTKPAEDVKPAPAQPETLQTDIFGNALDSDIPFFNEPQQ